jgi:hypothetical protein
LRQEIFYEQQEVSMESTWRESQAGKILRSARTDMQVQEIKAGMNDYTNSKKLKWESKWRTRQAGTFYE